MNKYYKKKHLRVILNRADKHYPTWRKSNAPESIAFRKSIILQAFKLGYSIDEIANECKLTAALVERYITS